MKLQGSIVVAAFLLTSASGFGQDADKDLEKFQGRWSVLRSERDGKPDPAKVRESLCVTIRVRGFLLTGWDGEVIQEEASLSVDPSRTPKAIDVRDDLTKQVNQGIYLLADGRLTICIDMGKKGRPKEFSSKDGRSLLVLQRAKERAEPDSPQAATEALFAAMSKKDWKAGFRCFTAEGQELAVVHLIDMTQFVVAIGTKEEENLEMLLKKHGFDVVKVRAQDKKLEEALKKDPKPLDPRKEIKRYADQIKDKEAFFAEALTWLDKIGSLGRQAGAPAQKQKLQEAAKKDQEPPDLGTVDSGRFVGSNVLRPYYGLKDLRIKGDTASGKLNQQWIVEFRRVKGRWLVDSTDYDDPDDLFLFDYLDDIHGWSF